MLGGRGGGLREGVTHCPSANLRSPVLALCLPLCKHLEALSVILEFQYLWCLNSTVFLMQAHLQLKKEMRLAEEESRASIRVKTDFVVPIGRCSEFNRMSSQGDFK